MRFGNEITASERALLEKYPWLKYPLSVVQSNAGQAAMQAVKDLEARARRFVVHFDVDVIDFSELPIADVPQFSQGMAFQDAMACLAIFASSPKFGGLTVTEFNPDHVDREGVYAATFLAGLTRALVGRV